MIKVVLHDNRFLTVDIFFHAVITCQNLYDPTYGRVNVTGYTPGYKAHYKCDYGYKLVGEAYRECLYTGYWGGEEPVCERKGQHSQYIAGYVIQLLSIQESPALTLKLHYTARLL